MRQSVLGGENFASPGTLPENPTDQQAGPVEQTPSELKIQLETVIILMEADLEARCPPFRVYCAASSKTEEPLMAMGELQGRISGPPINHDQNCRHKGN